MAKQLVTVKIQVGVDAAKAAKFGKTVPLDTTVDDLRRIIRLHMRDKIQEEDGVVLIWNGRALKNPDQTLEDLSMTNDSFIICIVSQKTGREIEQQLMPDDEDEDAQYQSDKVEPILDCEFKSRPFGFAVWANEKGENAIVTKVAGKNALKLGIQIGYCVYKVNDTNVFNKKHNHVLDCLKNTTCPLRITFLDLGREYTIAFKTKPLGFTVIQDREENNAKVSKINTRAAAMVGVKIGSYVVAVNNNPVFGLKHRDIIKTINAANFPINLRFRRPPKLLMVSRKPKVKK